jgi:hypothetical protein
MRYRARYCKGRSRPLKTRCRAMKTAKALDLIVPPSLLVREEPRRTGTIRLDLRCSIAVAVAMFVLPVNAQRVEIRPGGVRFGEGRPDRQVCAQLRRACLHKDELGEQGEGNCRRYRRTCG